jgi:glucose/arabinose dehydrogenase
VTLDSIFTIAATTTLSTLALTLSFASPLAPGGRAAAAAVGTTATIALVPLASGLNSALTVVHAGDGSGRLFIVLQGGQIMVFDGNNVLPRPFLDISALVSCCDERGLLGLAFHPNYATNGFFYVNYTNRRGDTVIARFSVSRTNRSLANPLSLTALLRVNQPFPNHNGGQLQFGPDGFLYIGLGDGGSGGDPLNNGQSLDTLLGKLLRIDVNGAAPYAVPASNPFVGVPGTLPEIWAYGLRNPWRFTFDRLTGDMFIGDVGQSEWEEIDFQPVASAGGENYGWRIMEGSHCFDPSTGCDQTGLVLPILEYNHELGCAVIGGYRYRGGQVQALVGRYLYGDFCSGTIWSAVPGQGGAWGSSVLLETGFMISSFGEGPDGELYVLSYGSSGTLYKVSGGQ